MREACTWRGLKANTCLLERTIELENSLGMWCEGQLLRGPLSYEVLERNVSVYKVYRICGIIVLEVCLNIWNVSSFRPTDTLWCMVLWNSSRSGKEINRPFRSLCGIQIIAETRRNIHQKHAAEASRCGSIEILSTTWAKKGTRRSFSVYSWWVWRRSHEKAEYRNFSYPATVRHQYWTCRFYSCWTWNSNLVHFTWLVHHFW